MGIIAFHTVINMYFFLNQYVALFLNCTEISGLGHNDNNHVSKNIASFSILTFKFVCSTWAITKLHWAWDKIIRLGTLQYTR